MGRASLFMMQRAIALTTLYAACAGAIAQPWMNTADPPEERAQKLVAEMTTAEKLSLFHGSCRGYTGNVCGIDRLKIPQQKFNDGPQGFRGHGGTSTAWPAALTVAAAFDDNLTRSYGEGMGEEFYDKGANVQLGPGVCVARVPRNGRNFEYVSGEDPYFGYRMAKALVTGIQSQGVVANAKHFIDNNQESARGTITSNIDERTEFEIYYPPFKGAIDAGLGSIMCSYNKECVDCDPDKIGNWSCENHDTLTRDLKGRLGFKGWVMSDWGATHSASMNRGLDQEMPGASHMGSDLAGMVSRGEVSMDHVNDSAVRILWPYFQVGIFDKPNENTNANNVTSTAHNKLARELSAAGTVLLKNNGILPLGPHVKNIAVIGDKAENPTVHGGGSGSVQPYYVAAPLNSISRRSGTTNNCSGGVYEQDIDYHNTDEQKSAHAASVDECCALCAQQMACNAYTFLGSTCWMKADAVGRTAKSGARSGICKKTGVVYASSADPIVAAKLAASADVAIVFVGTSSSEGRDRPNLGLGSEDDLIEAVAKVAGKKTVVVAVTPGALLTPWRDAVGAILTPFMPGQEYGNAITDLLFGDVNPGAKLPITFPKTENEMNFTHSQWPGTNGISVYSEGLNVGYRWYATHDVSPAFPFGHGLSYTSFVYSDFAVNGNTVTCKVKNNGRVDGSEVAQLYLGFPAVAKEPPKQLKGFQKLSIGAGKTATATFTLDDHSFSIWDVASHQWSPVPGDFRVMVGSSSGDLRLWGSISRKSVATTGRTVVI